MDLLFSSPQFPSNTNNGTLTLLSHQLVTKGHDARGVQGASGETKHFPITTLDVPEMGRPWWIRLWWYYRAWRNQIDSYLATAAHNPDIIVTNQRAHVPTVQGAAGHDIPVVSIIEGLGFMRFDPGNHDLDKTPQFQDLPSTSKLQYPFVRSLFRQQESAFRSFDAVVSLSGFLSDVVSASFGVDSRVIRTMVDTGDVRADSHDPQFITMVNPRSELKGADIFVSIARAMPDEQFLVAGNFATESHRRAAAALDNVTNLGWVDDMNEVYDRTKLLLVPSLVEEGGPRVIVEAFANGVPVVGTDRGGVPEFIGDAGAVVDDPYDTAEWASAVEGVLADHDRMQSLAQERARLFDVKKLLGRYESLLESLSSFED